MTQRTFIPGSEWLYFKIYTGYKTADELLTQKIYPYLQELCADGVIDGYFFIRYSDPEFHLRFRLHIGNPDNYTEIFSKFLERFQPEVENGSVAKILCDTYVREIERYGADTIELTEELFHADSEAIMQLLDKIADCPSDSRETVRWKTVMVLLDDTLAAFGQDLSEKVKLTTTMAERYK